MRLLFFIFVTVAAMASAYSGQPVVRNMTAKNAPRFSDPQRSLGVWNGTEMYLLQSRPINNTETRFYSYHPGRDQWQERSAKGAPSADSGVNTQAIHIGDGRIFVWSQWDN